MNEEPTLDNLFLDLDKTVEWQLDKVLDASSEKIKKELAVQSPLLPAEAVYEKEKFDIKTRVEQASEELDRFKEAVMAFNSFKDRFLTPVDIKQFDKEAKGFYEKFLEYTPEKLLEKPVKDVLGASDFVLYCFYVVGHSLCMEKMHAEASHIFYFLTVLNPLVKDYWMASGISERESRKFENALKAFAMAALIDNSDPVVYLASAECYIATKDALNAQAELEEAKTVIRHAGTNEKWRSHVEKIASEINKLKAR